MTDAMKAEMNAIEDTDSNYERLLAIVQEMGLKPQDESECDSVEDLLAYVEREGETATLIDHLAGLYLRSIGITFA
jgi:hypothetical protein